MRLRSLQARLAVRLGILFLSATALAVAALLYQTYLRADANNADALVDAMLREFIFDVAWIIPIFIAVTLLVGVLAIRRGLRPLREASARAAAIDPSAMSVRLPMQDMPTEIVPLIGGINRALDRLEEGFAVQRRFTANAAHQLRTPLAIITGALEAMDGDVELGALRDDVGRMNRLVEQLLNVARLDAVALDVSAEVDLVGAAADVVEYMAPLAIEHNRSLALLGTKEPVLVNGNRHAIDDALRNVVENALAHAPEGTEVRVEVDPSGAVTVSDRGAGVASENRDHLFDRFWRGASGGTGAGLGLAIVAEIMSAHGGRVDFEDNPGGGARFTLRFEP